MFAITAVVKDLLFVITAASAAISRWVHVCHHAILALLASAGILGAGWAALTNGFPIVYCPPVCEEAWPLTDPAHVGSIVAGSLVRDAPPIV